MTSKLLTQEEAATFLNLRPKTLARWRWLGKGPRFIKLGHAVRYTERDLIAFIQAGIRRSTSASEEEARVSEVL
jgi:Helix-turn-helix domain